MINITRERGSPTHTDDDNPSFRLVIVSLYNKEKVLLSVSVLAFKSSLKNKRPNKTDKKRKRIVSVVFFS